MPPILIRMRRVFPGVYFRGLPFIPHPQAQENHDA